MKETFFRLFSALEQDAIIVTPEVEYQFGQRTSLLLEDTILKDNNLFFIEEGHNWFDIIEFSESEDLLFSDRIISLFNENNIGGFESFRVNIEGNTNYHAIIVKSIAGRILNLEALNNMETRNVEFDYSTWDGSDFFSLENTLIYACTKRVKEILETAKCTNILIRPL